MSSKSKNTDPSRIQELKGDEFLKKNQDKKAFEAYKKALELDDTRLDLYDKVTKLHEKYSDNWDNADFAYNLFLTMKKQEIVDPTFKRIHASQEPESKEISEEIKKMFHAKTREIETNHVEKVVSYGAPALYPLINFLLGLKELAQINRKLKDKKDKGSP